MPGLGAVMPPRHCLRCRVGFFAEPPTNPIPFCPQCLPGEKSRPDCPLCGRDRPAPRKRGVLVSMCADCFAERRRKAKAALMARRRHLSSPEATQRADAAWPEEMDFKTGTFKMGSRIEAARRAGERPDDAEAPPGGG